MKKMIYIILLINGLLAYGQTAVKDVYEFPLKPGSEQWKQISIKERKEALQIPKRVLTKNIYRRIAGILPPVPLFGRHVSGQRLSAWI